MSTIYRLALHPETNFRKSTWNWVGMSIITTCMKTSQGPMPENKHEFHYLSLKWLKLVHNTSFTEKQKIGWSCLSWLVARKSLKDPGSKLKGMNSMTWKPHIPVLPIDPKLDGRIYHGRTHKKFFSRIHAQNSTCSWPFWFEAVILSKIPAKIVYLRYHRPIADIQLRRIFRLRHIRSRTIKIWFLKKEQLFSHVFCTPQCQETA